MKTTPLILALTSAAVLLCGPTAFHASAQPVVPPPAAVYQPLSAQQLDQLLGPIALYPDPLLAQILPASTLPTQIVLADRYVLGGGDPSQIDYQSWDPSVQALARYPSVLQYLDNNLNWTIAVGQAFLYQPEQVLESIQRLRISARNFGNLLSTPQQEIVDDDGDIEILPVEPDVIYVPVYQPDYVYIESGFSYTFGVGCGIGSWMDCDFDWHRHRLCFWDRNHPRPPYWWHLQPASRDAWMANQGTWRPEDHRGIDTARHIPANQHNPGNFGQNGQVPRPSQPDNNTIVRMPGFGPSSRPAATPRPAATRGSGSIYVANPPAPHPYAPNNGVSAGNEGSWNPGTYNNPRQENPPPAPQPESTWSAPVHHEPAQSEPVHSEPPHTEPPHSEPAHSEPVHVDPPHSDPPPAPSHTEPPASGGGGGGGGGGRH